MSTEPPADSPPKPAPHRRSPIPAILLIVFILAAGAYAYWRLLYYPTTPAYAVESLIEAGRKRDYARVYDLVKLTGPLKGLVRGPEDLRTYAERYPGLIPDVKEYRMEDSRTEGDKATVITRMTASQRGRTAQNHVHFELVRDEGIWRLDGEWLLREAMRQGLGGALLGGAED